MNVLHLSNVRWEERVDLYTQIKGRRDHLVVKNAVVDETTKISTKSMGVLRTCLIFLYKTIRCHYV